MKWSGPHGATGLDHQLASRESERTSEYVARAFPIAAVLGLHGSGRGAGAGASSAGLRLDRGFGLALAAVAGGGEPLDCFSAASIGGCLDAATRATGIGVGVVVVSAASTATGGTAAGGAVLTLRLNLPVGELELRGVHVHH